MKDLTHKRNRKHVRAPISVPIKFTVMSPDIYNNIKDSNGASRLRGLQMENGTGSVFTEQESFSTKGDTHVVDFLFRIDDKLDRILELLLRDEKDKEKLRRGRTLNISGAGMSITYEEPLRVGDILSTNFLVSKIPPAWLDLYCEVVRVLPNLEGEEATYEIALKFIDLNEEDREKIIFYTFQQQRGAIRSMKETDE
ncbi:MAG: PilZ domain-containing protein [Pseudomonadota bacterium]